MSRGVWQPHGVVAGDVWRSALGSLFRQKKNKLSRTVLLNLVPGKTPVSSLLLAENSICIIAKAQRWRRDLWCVGARANFHSAECIRRSSELTNANLLGPACC
jgi:hypothetical protein